MAGTGKVQGVSLATWVIVLACYLKVASGAACPSRIRGVPSANLGAYFPYNTSRPSTYANGTSAQQGMIYASSPSKWVFNCCPSGSIDSTGWDVKLTKDFGFIGEVSATCTDGTVLPNVTYGFNGSSTCPNDLSAVSKRAIQAVGSSDAPYQISASYFISQLFGVGVNDSNARNYSFNCQPGMEPIGFGARSSCYSIADFKVICGQIHSSADSLPKVALRTVNPCTSLADVTAVPSSDIGSNLSWSGPSTAVYQDNIRIYSGQQIISSAAGGVQTDCCNSGQITQWQIINTTENFLGHVSAICSDNTTLAPVIQSFNTSWDDPDCSTVGFGLDVTSFFPNPTTFRYSSDKAIYSFLQSSTIGAVRGSSSPDQEFSCPNGTVPVGYSARSACRSITSLKVYCRALQNASDVSSTVSTTRIPVGSESVSVGQNLTGTASSTG